MVQRKPLTAAQQAQESFVALCTLYARRQWEAAGKPDRPPVRFRVAGIRFNGYWIYTATRKMVES